MMSFAFLAASALAQTPAPPAFEVASVRVNQQYRPDDPSTARAGIERSPGGIAVRNHTLRRIAAWAYDVQNVQIVGPPWIDTERYDIVAKAGRDVSAGELRAMAQTLLADRFQMRFHRETRPSEVWALTVGKSGHKMKVSDAEELSEQSNPGGGTAIRGAAMSDFVREVGNDRAGPPVVDWTGLAGRFDFTIDPTKYRESMQARLASGPRPASEADVILTFMQEMFMNELGLRIERRRAPVEFLVIDRAEQRPSEN